jgi:hypothetical protein
MTWMACLKLSARILGAVSYSIAIDGFGFAQQITDGVGLFCRTKRLSRLLQGKLLMYVCSTYLRLYRFYG